MSKFETFERPRATGEGMSAATVANIRKLMAHADDVVLFEGDDSVTEDTEQVALGDLAKHRTALSVPYLDLHDVDDKVLALVRPSAVDAPADDDLEPSAVLRGLDGPLAVFLLAEPIPLPDGWLDAIPLDAEVRWAEGVPLFELVDGELIQLSSPSGVEAPVGALEAAVAPSPSDRGSDACGLPSGSSETVSDEPATLNDAIIIGTETEGFKAALNREVEILIGSMYGMHNRKNTQDGEWKSRKAPLIDLIKGFDGNANTPEFGFSRHPESKKKEGPCIVMGSSIAGARKAKAMKTMHFVGLDIDSGARLEDVVRKIEALGLFALVHTSFNHGKSGLQLKRDEVLRKLQIKGDPTIEQVRDYLRQHDKSRYEEAFIQAVTIKEAKKQVKDGVVIELDTPPLHKFRLFFPLATPVEIVEQGETHEEALSDWEDAVTGLAHSVLGIHFDTSCTDPSRLFFTARHPKGSDFQSIIVMGDPLKYEDIPRVRKASYTKNRDLNAFVQADDGDGRKSDPVLTPGGVDLRHTPRAKMELAEFLSANLPAEMVRGTSGRKQFVECVNAHRHGEGNDTDCYVTDGDDMEDRAVWHCSHASCQGDGTLERIRDAMAAELIDEHLFFLPVTEGGAILMDDDELEALEAERTDEQAREAAATVEGAATLVQEFGPNSSTDEIKALFVALGGGTADPAVRRRVHKALRDQKVSLKAEDLDSIWAAIKKEEDDRASADVAQRRALAQEKVKAQREAAKDSPPPFVPCEDATEDTVNAAAKNAAWLPSTVHYKDGWFYQTNFEDRKDSTPICRAFEVPFVAFGENEQGRTNEITIRYRHRSAQQGVVESAYKIGDTYKESGSFISRLADEGLEFHAQAKTEAIISLLRSVNTDNEAVLLNKAGWHGDLYISPSGVVVSDDDIRYILHPLKRVSDEVRGTLADHHEAATTALTGKNAARFMPGYLSGAVGCLTDFIENPMSPILMNEGTANRGKSTSLKAGAAWFSKPDHTGLFLKADSTPTAIENFAERAQGSVLALDEDGASKMDADEKQRMVMQWAEGSGRNRGTREADVRRTKTWRTCFTTSSERGFLAVLTAADTDIRSGTVSRVFTVNYDSVELLDRTADAELLASYDVLAGSCFGVAGPVFARKLMELGREEVRARVSAELDDWANEAKGAGERVVRVAALFTVAGKIAQEAGIFSEDVPVREYMDLLLEETLEARASHLDTEAQTLNNLRASIRRGVQMQVIVEAGDSGEYNRSEILGYWMAPKVDDTFSEAGRGAGRGSDAHNMLHERTYILPLDRLGKLVKADPKVVADKLRAVGGLIDRKKGQTTSWKHAHIPGEGVGDCIRVGGMFVHGEPDEDES